MEFGLMEFAKLQSLTPSPPGTFLITTDAARGLQKSIIAILTPTLGEPGLFGAFYNLGRVLSSVFLSCNPTHFKHSYQARACG